LDQVMTTPAQLAKEFAAAHGFSIVPRGRRYAIVKRRHNSIVEIAEVGGYPAALNAMKRYVAEHASDVVTAVPDECAATGESCNYGPWGRDCERQCKYCGKVQDALNAPAAPIVKAFPAGWESIEGDDPALAETIDNTHNVVMAQTGRGAKSPVFQLDDAAFAVPPMDSGLTPLQIMEEYAKIPPVSRETVLERLRKWCERFPWIIKETHPNGGTFVLGERFANRADALKHCRQMRNTPGVENGKRTIIYRPGY
jgi:hypothetical protein